MADGARGSGDRTPRWKTVLSNYKLTILFVGLVILGLAVYVIQSSQEPAIAYMMTNDAVVIGMDSPQLDSACQQQFGSGWESKIWVPNNPPTIVCENGQGTTGYMDMPVEIQKDLDIVSAANNSTKP